jgi:hypothetical protein
MECGSEASAHAEANASALQTGQRAAPLSHAVGEGLGVRAESGRTSHTVNPSDVPLSATPLSQSVGEGLGVRAESGRTSHTVNPSGVPLSATPLSQSVGEGLGVRAKTARLFPTQRTQVPCPYQTFRRQFSLVRALIPIARAEFTIAPLLQVPPASRGEPRKARPLGSPCVRGEPYGGGHQLLFL